MMNKSISIKKLKTGISGLDNLLDGGLPQGSLTVLGGSPGAGKTILSQQFAFHNATKEKCAVFFQTLSEPTVKTLTYLKQFEFFDESKLGTAIHFVDLGDILRLKGLEEATALFTSMMKKYCPTFVFIDSFKVFSDLADGREELRKFSYQVAIELLVWECTAFLLGEFTIDELVSNPLSSICDSIIMMDLKITPYEVLRNLRVLKMRGTHHDTNYRLMEISSHGIQIYGSPLAVRGETSEASLKNSNNPQKQRLSSQIESLDRVLGQGFTSGTTVVISGEPGTGKSLVTLEIIYRSALNLQQKGIFFSLDETPQEIIERAMTFGWDLVALIDAGLFKIIHLPQNTIRIERDLLMIEAEVGSFNAERIVIDSISVLFNRVEHPSVARERMYDLLKIIQCTNCLALVTKNSSTFGMEETMVHGIILLSSQLKDEMRTRFLEIYKLRNSRHETGQFSLEFGSSGFILNINRMVDP